MDISEPIRIHPYQSVDEMARNLGVQEENKQSALEKVNEHTQEDQNAHIEIPDIIDSEALDSKVDEQKGIVSYDQFDLGVKHKKQKNRKEKHLFSLQDSALLPSNLGKEESDKKAKAVETEIVKREGKEEIYPLSVVYDTETKRRLMAIRFTTIIVLLILVIPKDFLFFDIPFVRLTFFESISEAKTFSFSNIEEEFTIQTEGCDLEFEPYSGSTKKFKIETFFGKFVGKPKYSKSRYQMENSDKFMRCVAIVKVPREVPKTFLIKTKSTYLAQIRIQFPLQEEVAFQEGLKFEIVSADILVDNVATSDFELLADEAKVAITNLNSANKRVILQNGIYTENLGSSTTKVEQDIDQKHGFVCLYAPSISNTESSAGCETEEEQRFQPIQEETSSLEPEAECKVKAQLCVDAECSGESMKSEVKVFDGFVQIGFHEQQETMNYGHWKYFQSFTIEGRKNLQAINEYIEADSENDFIQVFIITSHNYEVKWVYTNKLPYVQAQVWPISAVSASLLKPTIREQEFFMSSSTCPSLPATDTGRNFALQKRLSEQLPQTSQSMVVYINQDNYFSFLRESHNGFLSETEISFAYGNTLIFVAFVVSGILALLGSAIMVFILWKAFEQAQIQYAKFIEEQRNYARQKRINEIDFQDDDAAILQLQVVKRINRDKMYIERRGLFSNSFEKIKKNPDKVTKKEDFNIGFFQAVSNTVDYQIRQKSNSLVNFLQSVPISKEYFKERRLLVMDFTQSSLSLKIFQRKYQQFCIKNGLKIQNVLSRESRETLQKFSLILRSKIDKQTRAYQNIRFKTFEEKQRYLAQAKGEQRKQNQSLVQKFLESECMHSSFNQDTILQADLEEAFMRFAIKHSETANISEKLEGNQAFNLFGSNLGPPEKVHFIKGIVEGTSSTTGALIDESLGLIRRPIYVNEQNIPMWRRIRRLKRKYLTGVILYFKRTDGFLSIALNVIVNFFFIVLTPIPMVFMAYLTLAERTQFKADFYSTYYTIQHLARAEASSPWWNEVEDIHIFFYLLYFIAFFYFIAFLELSSYYTNGYDNNGKFTIKKTFLKKFVSNTFLLLLAIFTWAYMMMMVLILSWSILGAIINPSKFLPYASASSTFLFFIKSRLSSIEKFVKDVYKELDDIIQKKIMGQLSKNVEKLQLGVGKAVANSGVAKKITKKADAQGFQKALLKNMQIDTTKSSPADIEGCLSGNVDAIAKVTSQQMGINKDVVSFMMACMQKDKAGMVKNLKVMAEILKVNADVLIAFVEIAIGDYAFKIENVDSLQQVDGQLILNIKKLFQTLFPDIQVEILDGIIQLATQGDPSSFVSMFSDEFNLPYKELFQAIIGLIRQDSSSVRGSIITFLRRYIKFPANKEINYEDLIWLLEWIQHSQADKILENFPQIQDIIGTRNTFAFYALMCFSAKNQDLSRDLLERASENMFMQLKLPSDTQLQQEIKACAVQAVDTYLSFFTLVNGQDIDLKELCKRNFIKCDLGKAEFVDEISSGSELSLQSFLNSLRLNGCKGKMLELFGMAFNKNLQFVSLGRRMGLQPQMNNFVMYLVMLYKNILRYEFAFRMRIRSEKDFQKKRSFLMKQPDREKAEFDIKKIQKDNSLEVTNFKSTINEAIYEIKTWSKLLEKTKVIKLKDIPFQDNYNPSMKMFEKFKREFFSAVEKSKKCKENYQKFEQEIGNKHFLYYQGIIKQPLVQKFLTFKMEKQISSLAIILLKCQEDVSSTDPVFEKCLKKVSKLIGIDEFNLDFFLDLFKGDPVKIFKCKNPEVVIQDEVDDRLLQYDIQRLTKMAIILSSTNDQVKNLAREWINQYQLIFRGKQQLPFLCTYGICISNSFRASIDKYRNILRFSSGNIQVFEKYEQSVIDYAITVIDKQQEQTRMKDEANTENIFSVGDLQQEKIDDFMSLIRFEKECVYDNGKTMDQIITETKIANKKLIQEQEDEQKTWEDILPDSSVRLNDVDVQDKLVDDSKEVLRGPDSRIPSSDQILPVQGSKSIQNYVPDIMKLQKLILLLRKSDQKTLKLVLGITDDTIARIVSMTLKYFAYPYPHILIAQILNVGEEIPVFTEINTGDSLLRQELQTSELNSKFNVFQNIKEENKSKYLLSQFLLAQDAMMFKNIMKHSYLFDQSKFQSQIDKMVQLANSVIRETQDFKNGHTLLLSSPIIDQPHTFIVKLFDEGYFREFSKVIFESQNMPTIHRENLLGILLGIQSDEPQLIRFVSQSNLYSLYTNC